MPDSQGAQGPVSRLSQPGKQVDEGRGEERGQEPLRLSGEVSAARAPVRLVRGHSTGARGLVQVECAGLGQWGQNARLGWRASPKGHILSSKVLLPFQAPDSAEARLGLLGELFC